MLAYLLLLSVVSTKSIGTYHTLSKRGIGQWLGNNQILASAIGLGTLAAGVALYHHGKKQPEVPIDAQVPPNIGAPVPSMPAIGQQPNSSPGLINDPSTACLLYTSPSPRD